MSGQPSRFLVGLTGGIGSGKSAAASYLMMLGAGVVDTDEISHRLTGPGGAAISAIRTAFGPDYITADGRLDRTRMRTRVFSEPTAREMLEAILHPMIRDVVRQELESAEAAYSVLVVPLLFETGQYRDSVNRVLVVDCDESIQRQRVMARSGLSDEEVRRIMAAQCSREARLQQADDVVDNSGSIEALHRQLDRLHQQYLEQAHLIGR